MSRRIIGIVIVNFLRPTTVPTTSSTSRPYKITRNPRQVQPETISRKIPRRVRNMCFPRAVWALQSQPQVVSSKPYPQTNPLALKLQNFQPPKIRTLLHPNTPKNYLSTLNLKRWPPTLNLIYPNIPHIPAKVSLSQPYLRVALSASWAFQVAWDFNAIKVGIFSFLVYKVLQRTCMYVC